jgi:hypothetical protein
LPAVERSGATAMPARFEFGEPKCAGRRWVAELAWSGRASSRQIATMAIESVLPTRSPVLTRRSYHVRDPDFKGRRMFFYDR